MIKNKYFIIGAVYIKGDKLNPENVSSVLGLLPVESRIKGSSKRLVSGAEILAPTGLWVLREECYCESVDDFITEFISKLRPIGEKKALLQGVEEFFIDLFISLLSDSDGNADIDFIILPETLTVLNDIGIPIKLSVNISNDE